MTTKNLPPLALIKREDVTDAPEWFEGFLDKLNPELEFLRSVFNGGITLAGNVQGITKTLQIRTQAGYAPDGEFTVVRFATGLPAAIRACDVKQVIDLDDENAVLAGPYYADWRGASGEVRVRFISGLLPSHRYQITFHVW